MKKVLLIPLVLLLAMPVANAASVNVTVKVVPPPPPVATRLTYLMMNSIPVSLASILSIFVLREGTGTTLEKLLRIFIVIALVVPFIILIGSVIW